jgi:hypothetical protein
MYLYVYIHISLYIYIFILLTSKVSPLPFDSWANEPSLRDQTETNPVVDDDDVYLEYYSGKGFLINYSCLHVLRKTHILVQ